MLKFFIYISVFIPLYFLIIIKTIIDLIFNNISCNTLNISLLIMLNILIIIGTSGVLFITKKQSTNKEKIKIITCKNITDQHFLNYFSLFVLFAITFDLSLVSYTIIFITILFFIGIVYIKNNLFYINPFLNILGYSFYEITFEKENEQEKQTGSVFSKQKIYENKTYIANKNLTNLWLIK